MKFKNLLLILIGIGFLIFPVNAETGTISVSDIFTSGTYSFTLVDGNPRTYTFSTLLFDNTNYNHVSSFTIYITNSAFFLLESNYTTFTIVSGGTGSGYITYSKTGKYIDYNFNSGTTITGSQIGISLDLNIFDANNMDSATGSTTFTGQAQSSTKPICIRTSINQCLFNGAGSSGTISYAAIVSKTLTNGYAITYPQPNKYLVNITKWGAIGTEIKIHNQTAEQFTETTFNLVNFTSPLLNYGTGIYINVTTSTGAYTDTLINSSGVSGIPSPTNTPVINNNTGKGISFDHDTYTIGDTANISWAISDSIWNSFSTQTVVLKKVGIDDTTSISNVAPKTGSSLWLWTSCANPATQSVLCGYGTYQAIIYTNLLGILETNRETAEAQVYPAQDSYILINSSAPIKTPVNVTAFIGVGGVGSNGMLATYFFDVNSNDYIGESQVVGLQSGTNYRNLTFKQIGKYRVVLKNIVTNQEYAAKIIDTYHTQISAPYNFTTSNITLNKVSFTFNDVMIGNYKVDSVNYSTGYPTYIDIYNLDTNSITAEFYGTGQIWDDTSKQLGDVFIRIENLPAISGFPETKWIPGNNLIRLMLNNSDAGNSTVLSFVQFTLSSINSNGYGLTVNKNKILSGETVTVSATIPPATTANLTLIDPNGKVTSRKVNISISFTDKLKTVGQYQYQLMNANNEIEMSVYVEVTAPASSTVPATAPSGDTAISNAGSNMRTFLSQPFFWGLVILALILYTIRNTRVVKEVSIFVIFVEDVMGLFAPYTIFILIGLIIFAAISLRTGKQVVTGEE